MPGAFQAWSKSTFRPHGPFQQGPVEPGVLHGARGSVDAVEIPEAEVVVLGTTGTPMDSQDAGKWAFMKNMGMPGSIADELSAQIRPAAGAR